MTPPLQLQVMAALLQQARLPAQVSGLLAAAALLLVVLAVPAAPVAVAAGLSLLAGLVQGYYALRIGFDRQLLQALASEDPQTALAQLDAALQALGLRKAAALPRGWDARWQGMRRLLRGQGLWLVVQALALLAALLLRSPA